MNIFVELIINLFDAIAAIAFVTAFCFAIETLSKMPKKGRKAPQKRPWRDSRNSIRAYVRQGVALYYIRKKRLS